LGVYLGNPNQRGHFSEGSEEKTARILEINTLKEEGKKELRTLIKLCASKVWWSGAD